MAGDNEVKKQDAVFFLIFWFLAPVLYFLPSFMRLAYSTACRRFSS